MTMSDRAVIYARFSSARQQEQSIDGQVRYCTQYAEQRGFQVVGSYADRAISGTTDERPAFQRMIADAAKKKFDYIIVWKLDRFSRDRYASAMYKHELKKNNVKVISATEGIGEGDESVILEAILEAMAEMYVKQLSQNVTRGMREAALQGHHASGTAPYGYRIEDKKLVIVPEEAAVVRYVFEEYAKGVSKRELADKLNAQGLRTHTGAPFRFNSFQTMLKNEKYIGTFKWSDIVIEDSCPAIVDKELFEKCQQRIKANKRNVGRKAKTKIEYLLKGKLFCGCCGAPMVGDGGTSKTGKQHHYYTCTARKKGECGKAREQKGFIEWYIVEQTLEYVLQPARLEYIAENVVAAYNKNYNTNELEELKARKAALEREYDKITDSLIHATSDRMIDAINRKASEVEARLNALDDDIAAMSAGCEAALTIEEVQEWLRGFCDGDAADPDFQRRIIDVLVNAVYLYDDKVVIYFNVRSGKQITYIEMQSTVEGASPEGAQSSIIKPHCPPNATISEHYYIFVNGIVGVVITRKARA